MQGFIKVKMPIKGKQIYLNLLERWISITAVNWSPQNIKKCVTGSLTALFSFT